MRAAAAAYDRASRVPYARIPAPTPAGAGLRAAARMLCAARSASGRRDDTTILDAALLAVRLMQLAEAVRLARQARDRSHQARAAALAWRRYADAGRHAAGHPASLANQSFPRGSFTTTLKPDTTVRPASPSPPKQQSPRRSR